MKFSRIGTLGGAILALSFAQGASALTIDSFDDTQEASVDNAPGSPTTLATPGAFSDERTVSVARATGANDVAISINAGGGSTLAFSAGASSTGSALIEYTATGGGDIAPGVDLTDGGSQDAFGIEIQSGDFSADLSLTVRDSNNVSHTATLATPLLPLNVVFFFEFTAFTNAGVDLSDVEFLSLGIVAGSPNTDLVLDLFDTRQGPSTPSGPNPVPVPGTVALLGLGLLGFARSRKSA